MLIPGGACHSNRNFLCHVVCSRRCDFPVRTCGDVDCALRLDTASLCTLTSMWFVLSQDVFRYPWFQISAVLQGWCSWHWCVCTCFWSLIWPQTSGRTVVWTLAEMMLRALWFNKFNYPFYKNLPSSPWGWDHINHVRPPPKGPIIELRLEAAVEASSSRGNARARGTSLLLKIQI